MEVGEGRREKKGGEGEGEEGRGMGGRGREE